MNPSGTSFAPTQSEVSPNRHSLGNSRWTPTIASCKWSRRSCRPSVHTRLPCGTPRRKGHRRRPMSFPRASIRSRFSSASTRSSRRARCSRSAGYSSPETGGPEPGVSHWGTMKLSCMKQEKRKKPGLGHECLNPGCVFIGLCRPLDAIRRAAHFFTFSSVRAEGHVSRCFRLTVPMSSSVNRRWTSSSARASSHAGNESATTRMAVAPLLYHGKI